jgi:predicted N-acyltransferase
VLLSVCCAKRDALQRAGSRVGNSDLSNEHEATIQVLSSIDEIDAAAWDRNANPDPKTHNPFVSHAFLKALEDAECVRTGTGWQPQHLILSRGPDAIDGCMPLYAKSHSKGEYVFDYGWAEAYENAGGDYYPKLLSAVPFTPVPGHRLLVHDGPEQAERRGLLATGAIELVKRYNVSSFHLNFLTETEWEEMSRLGFLQRTDQQFHWRNDGYATFEDFLAQLSSRKRKTIRKERREALSNGLRIEQLTGSDIEEHHWDAMYAFYMDTGSRKWGRPYLSREFFSLLGQTMADCCLLIMVKNGDDYVAGAFNIIGGDCLYGRYWGAIEHHPCLHFEVCYYQAIDYAIAHQLDRVEAGAQGEHKLARGYMPTATYSAHWIPNPSFRRAVGNYLEDERRYMERARDQLAMYGPYRKASEVPTDVPIDSDND